MFRTYQCDVLSHPHDLNKSLESSPGPPLANEICRTYQRVRYISLCDALQKKTAMTTYVAMAMQPQLLCRACIVYLQSSHLSSLVSILWSCGLMILGDLIILITLSANVHFVSCAAKTPQLYLLGVYTVQINFRIVHHCCV